MVTEEKESPTITRESAREQRKSARLEAKQTKKEQKIEKKIKKFRRRLIPMWVRIILVLALCAGALVAGLMVGYGVIGNGEPADALDKSTWQHIVDIVKKEE
ncbi:ferric-dicitrate binding protein FerR (iron transport regulator) [Salirhabdus euzebyi]|uniref:Ferric-dicitrate binding protein FerR (Iron transport regulator) n=1 Tax=Salirhabdus euzebyi TaxID=394506 RepID=A0A841Q659_9BACI|nr:DNA-directed RNA polymerase subunit beta [Salirhabdus euzebyi]MBB6453989.1 ferric-dicitrate binding protein FerR (iron transport regulator) [Salirhabdus euzebyi]